jgi:hypothetical protein
LDGAQSRSASDERLTAAMDVLALWPPAQSLTRDASLPWHFNRELLGGLSDRSFRSVPVVRTSAPALEVSAGISWQLS